MKRGRVNKREDEKSHNGSVSYPIHRLPVNAMDSSRIPGSVLSQYLFNQRWVWSLRMNEKLVLESTSVSQILDKLLKYVLS